MTRTTISGFTQAAQQAQQWVNELAQELDWTEQRAYHLCAPCCMPFATG